MREINIPPFLEFERLVVCNDYDEKFVYTAENLSKLKDMKITRKMEVENAKQLATEKREALNVKVKVKVQSFEDERIGHKTVEPVEIVHIIYR